MKAFDADPMLRRLERRALAFVVVAAAVALGARRGQPDVALGVLGGGLLIGTSYWAIRASADGLVSLVARGRLEAAPQGAGDTSRQRRKSRRKAALTLLWLTGRYALLASLAYVMIARFRLHPIGLLIGVSSIAASASVEVIRLMAGSGPPAPP